MDLCADVTHVGSADKGIGFFLAILLELNDNPSPRKAMARDNRRVFLRDAYTPPPRNVYENYATVSEQEDGKKLNRTLTGSNQLALQSIFVGRSTFPFATHPNTIVD